jgi:transposase
VCLVEPKTNGKPGNRQKAHRKRIGSSGGRPVTYDRTAYRGRNVIERAFNGVKHWRGLATRYDKHAIVYRAGLVLAAVLP